MNKDKQKILEKYLGEKTFEKDSTLLLKIDKLEDRGVDVENFVDQIIKIADSIKQLLQTGTNPKGLESVIRSLITREEVHCG